MNKGRVFHLKNFKILNSLASNRSTLLLVFLFALGILIGSVCFFKSETATFLADYSLSGFIDVRDGSTFFKVFFSSLLLSAVYLLFVFIFGTSIFGTVTVPVIIMFRGFMYGCTAALLYSKYSVKGVAFHAILVIVPAVIVMLALLSAARTAVEFSVTIARSTLPRSMPVNLSDAFRRYCIRFLWLLLTLIFSALADAFLSYFLFNSFKLV